MFRVVLTEAHVLRHTHQTSGFFFVFLNDDEFFTRFLVPPRFLFHLRDHFVEIVLVVLIFLRLILLL